MNKILWREAALVLLTGLLCWYPVPMLLALPPMPTLIWVGLLLGLTFMPMYALAHLGGAKMPETVRRIIGVVAWVGVAFDEFVLVAAYLRGGTPLNWVDLYLPLAPAAFGLLLAVLGALRGATGARARSALDALYAYSLPMVGVRWLLVSMVANSLELSAIALQAGAIYMLLHGLLRLYWPGPAEGVGEGPLVVKHPVPEYIVGLVERAARRRARPYATGSGGERDRRAISVTCPPGEADGLAATLADALKDRPFIALVGETVGEEVEVVVRPQGIA